MGTKGYQRHILGRKVSFLRISLPTVAKDTVVVRSMASLQILQLHQRNEKLFKDERCKCKTCGNIQHQPTVISPSILTDVFSFPHPLGTHGGGMRFRMVTCALPSVDGLRAVASMEKWGFVSGHPLRT
ncbi:hypothetical protein AAG906_022036 [Vitis piasezkii]